MKRICLVLLSVGLTFPAVLPVRADIFTQDFASNLFLTNLAPPRFLYALEDEPGNLFAPSANPVDAWNPASLMSFSGSFAGADGTSITESLHDNLLGNDYSRTAATMSSAYYLEPTRTWMGNVALGWSSHDRNLDASRWLKNTLERKIWSGGAVWALPVWKDRLNAGLMLGYRRIYDVKINELVGEDFTAEMQGFYGKAGVTAFLFPWLSAEAAYAYGGVMIGGQTGYEFFEKIPTLDDQGFDFSGYTFGGNSHFVVRYPDSMGGMVRMDPGSLLGLPRMLSVYGGAARIFWTKYEASERFDFYWTSIYLNDQVYRVRKEYLRDVTQTFGGASLNLMNIFGLQAMAHTDPDPDPDRTSQVDRVFYSFTLFANLFDAFILRGQYLYGEGTTTDASYFRDKIQQGTFGIVLPISNYFAGQEE